MLVYILILNNQLSNIKISFILMLDYVLTLNQFLI
jgi:hypothetical protein